jgi:hypothetical protein
MEESKTTSRIHPVFTTAAVALVVVSLAGLAAVTGLLPRSHSAPDIHITTPRDKLPFVGNPPSGAAQPAAPGATAAGHASSPTMPAHQSAIKSQRVPAARAGTPTRLPAQQQLMNDAAIGAEGEPWLEAVKPAMA